MDWFQILTSAGVLGALSLSFRAWLNNRPAMAKAELEGASALWGRIHALEKDQVREREECNHKIASLEAKVADLQHDLVNETMSFDAFLLLAEANPEKVLEQIPRIKEMRAAHRERMAVKKGQREGVAISGSDGQ